MSLILRILINALAVFALAYILPGVMVNSYVTAITVAIVLSVLNLLLKPVLTLFTLPITVLTLGLFLLVINALIVMLVDKLVDGFAVNSFWTAILFSILLSFVQSILYALTNTKEN